MRLERHTRRRLPSPAPRRSEVLIRAACSDDEPLIQAFVGGLSLMSRYQRFFLSLRELPRAMMDHLLRADPGAEAALLALNVHGDASTDVVGLVQYAGCVGRARARRRPSLWRTLAAQRACHAIAVGSGASGRLRRLDTHRGRHPAGQLRSHQTCQQARRQPRDQSEWRRTRAGVASAYYSSQTHLANGQSAGRIQRPVRVLTWAGQFSSRAFSWS